jgi:hypothetical protein
MYGTKTSFCFLLLVVLTFSACSDEQERGRKWCRKAAQLAGSLCLEGKLGAEGDVRIRIFATTDVSEVNLTELGGTADAPRDGSPNSVNPGSGKVYWNSDNFTHFLTITLNAAQGDPGRYAPLIRPSGNGSKGETRSFTLFLSGNEYAFVPPE